LWLAVGDHDMNQAVETRENLAGLVERVTFHNEENGFCGAPGEAGVDQPVQVRHG
jgi:hypothetical protein